MKDRTGQIWELDRSHVYLIVGPSQQYAGQTCRWVRHPAVLIVKGVRSYFTPEPEEGCSCSIDECVTEDGAGLDGSGIYKRLA